MKTYVVWNNKGGVGKSTIMFNLTSRYAELNPNMKVLAIDLCPQANSTMMFLGGGIKGEDCLLRLQTASDTVVGYIYERMQILSGNEVNPKEYHLQVHKHNDELPDHLWLIPGDGTLELIANAINYYSNATIPESAWKNVHYWISNMIKQVTGHKDDWTVFIDTNPSFAVHTELAIVAATHLIVPFKADDSSRVATKALFQLLYGPGTLHPVYSKHTFAKKAEENNVALPLCHLFIGNQFTQYLGSATAFSAMSQAVIAELYNLYASDPKRYSDPGAPIQSKDDFRNHFVYELRDFNSAGVVAAHQGRLLSGLKEAKYDVYLQQVQLDKTRIKQCSDSIDAIISRL